MPSHMHERLEQDISRIQDRILEMAGRCEGALREALRAAVEGSRQAAYLVILRDQFIDELEKEIDRLCLEFLVRQQPAGEHLRFVYAAIKVNAQLERVGDYAESIARQSARLEIRNLAVSFAPFEEIARHAIAMLHDAVKAFVQRDATLARDISLVEDKVDVLRRELDRNLVRLCQEGRIPLEALTPLLTISRRFERVTDQARNICAEVLYLCTGEYTKHRSQGIFRVLFVETHNNGRSQMAEAILTALNHPQLVAASAGVEPRPPDPRLERFLAAKDLDVSRQFPKSLEQVPNWEHYQLIVAFDRRAQKQFSQRMRNAICLDWAADALPSADADDATFRTACEDAFRQLQPHIHDLAEAITGQN